MEALEAVDRHLSVCTRCGGYTGTPPRCEICRQEDRLPVLVVVAEPEDVWALDALAPERYRYHVLGGVLNALEGIGPDSLNLTPLRTRIPDEGIQEVVLALGGTFEEQTTAYFLLDWFREHFPDLRISRIAVGLPMGREVGQADEETLREALIHRQPFEPDAP
jgi:recombination protein RecR